MLFHGHLSIGKAALSLTAVGTLVVSSAIGSSEKIADQDGQFTQEIKPILENFCAPCHAGESAAGGLDLANVLGVASVQANLEGWSKVEDYVISAIMPPAGFTMMPSTEEREKLASWVKKALDSVKVEPTPGRVTVRRLNRAEYNNTVRDLLGVDLSPADDFPSDDVGYGFDNIGDVLTISPLLMEKYFYAAERLAEAAIPLPAFAERKFEASELSHGTGSRIDGSGDLVMFTRDVATVFVNAPKDGQYRIKVRAYAQQGGPDVAKMSILVDNQTVGTLNVTAPRNKPADYEIPVTLKEGRVQVGASFINDFYRAAEGNRRAEDRNLFLQTITVIGPEDEGDIGSNIVTVYPGTLSHEKAARQVIKEFAVRAYRRPVQPKEVDDLFGLYMLARKNGESYERGLQVAVTGALVNPNFLFRLELDGRDSDGDTEWIGDYALASRLSYFLWGSMPDAELFDLAERGLLRNEEVLNQQVERMVNDPKAKGLVDGFAGQWLQLRLLETLSPDSEVFKSFSDDLKGDMITETELFFEYVLRENRPITDFLDSGYTFLNERLAAHYGIGGVRGPEFRKVDVAGGDRGGLITQGSMLTVTSNPNRTSPSKRGKWLMENLIGSPPPPPPPNVGVIEEGQKMISAATVRERMEQHRADPACAPCHVMIDPLGFSLEKFNGVGQKREVELGERINDSGVLPDGTEFSGIDGLREVLMSRKDEFVKTLAEKVLVYALGRGLSRSDSAAIDKIAEQTVNNEYRFQQLVKAVVLSEPFRKRQVNTE